MNPELEALLQSYDAWVNAGGVDAHPLRDKFELLLDDAAAKGKISKDVLREAIRCKYIPWVRANQKPPTIPPTA